MCLVSVSLSGSRMTQFQIGLHAHPVIWSERPTLHVSKPGFHFPLKQACGFSKAFSAAMHSPALDYTPAISEEKLPRIQKASAQSIKRTLDGHQKNRALKTSFFSSCYIFRVFFFQYPFQKYLTDKTCMYSTYIM